MRSTAAPYTESRLTRSVANERVGFPVVEQSLTGGIKLTMAYGCHTSRQAIGKDVYKKFSLKAIK